MSTCGDESVPATPDVRKDGCPPLEPAVSAARDPVWDTYEWRIYTKGFCGELQGYHVPGQEQDDSGRLLSNERWGDFDPVVHRVDRPAPRRWHYETGPPKVDWEVVNRQIEKVQRPTSVDWRK